MISNVKEGQSANSLRTEEPQKVFLDEALTEVDFDGQVGGVGASDLQIPSKSVALIRCAVAGSRLGSVLPAEGVLWEQRGVLGEPRFPLCLEKKAHGR